MNRRRFLLAAGMAGLPLAKAPETVAAERASALLFVVDLAGGNDGLNTLIPVRSSAYRRARPTLAIDARYALSLEAGQALHPSLSPLMTVWDAGELALIQGVGCPQASGSHARASEILDTASLADDPPHAGWLAQGGATARALPALSFSSDQNGLFRGLPSFALAAAQLVGKTLSVTRSAASFEQKVDAIARSLPTHRGGGLFHFVLPGFDTHENQRVAQAQALDMLARGLARLRRALIDVGRWQDSVIMTRSEFGRMADENLSGGTDHGNAGIQIVLGGRVQGGLHGVPLDAAPTDARGRFVPGIDFRAVYATVARDVFRQRAAPDIAHAGCFEHLFRQSA